MKFVIFLVITQILNLCLIETLCNRNENSVNYKKFSNSKFQLGAQSRTKFKSLFEINLAGFEAKSLNMTSNDQFQGYPLVSADSTFDLGLGPVYFQGWNRYFIVRNGTNTASKNFCINHSFKQEQNLSFKSNHLVEPTSNDITPIYISDENHFYFILTDNYLSVITSRFHDIAMTVDILDIKSLFDIKNENTNIKGGIQDLGNFQEGFCFLLRGKSSNNTKLENYKWVICADDYLTKMELMKKLIVLKIRYQVSEKGKRTESTNINFISKMSKIVNGNNSTNSQLFNSNWINLQDWSGCTLKCGGGIQILHRYCLKPPKGKPCNGEADKTRPCNTQPCTKPTEEVIDSAILPTEIRMVSLSKRPQRYEKCLLKEEDLDIIRFDVENLKIPPKIPSRVVMNNRTITIFETGSYDSTIASYFLNELKILEPYKEDPKKCLKIGVNKNKFNIMCIMCTDNSNTNNEGRIKSWIKDINEFRYDCKATRPNLNKSLIISDKDPRILKLKKELVEEDIKKQLYQTHFKDEMKEEYETQKTLKMAQLIAAKTLEKEMKYEERLEKEELMREQKEDEEMREAYLCEERKKTNLIKALLKKNEPKNKKEIEMKQKIARIENDLKIKIMTNRQKIMKKINLLKLAHQRKKNRYKQQITEVRRSLTQNIMSAEKIGDEKRCIDSILKNEEEVYCNVSFSDDPLTHENCKNKEYFCFICCDNEFGEMHQEERELCISNCDEKTQNYEAENEENNKNVKESEYNFESFKNMSASYVDYNLEEDLMLKNEQ